MDRSGPPHHDLIATADGLTIAIAPTVTPGLCAQNKSENERLHIDIPSPMTHEGGQVCRHETEPTPIREVYRWSHLMDAALAAVPRSRAQARETWRTVSRRLQA
ncbi:globin family protein [Rhizobium sp. PDO1-076]|uniref:hypothetical protein n=1 Tax=Rhizobium sp. PDO1-076 TaxID=1125979 RepID=UPI00114644C0|nr:hypothetical protein [Rhizobium sp. PDO1-076]